MKVYFSSLNNLKSKHLEFVAENLELIIPRTYMKDADTEGYSWFFRVTAEVRILSSIFIKNKGRLKLG